MRNVSKKYIETMETRRDFYAVGEITFADGTQKTLSKEDFSLTGNSVIDSSGSTSFPLGLLIPKQITLSLVNDDDRWSEYDFYGASIYLQTKFDLDDSTTESLNIGTFTVISPETYGTTVEVTAMDDSYKTDKPYDTQYDYPMSVGVALRDCCSTCDILLGTNSFPNSDYVIPTKPENLTHRQFIGLCAQIAGGNARFDEFNRLEIISYDFSPLEIDSIDGGTFNPWTEGENYDGGTFNPWTTGTTIDGGAFGDRDSIHVLYQFKSGIVIEVDDVVITGVQMESEDEEGNKTTHLYGKEGYVLSLENQLAVGKEEEVLERIGEKIVGIRFRPFSGDHIALPTAEFMDLAYIIDRKQNVYKSVLTDVIFSYFGFTNLKCSADSPLRNSSTHLSNEVKAIIEARKMVERERTEREKAVQNLQEALAKGSGMYPSEEVQPDGSRIYYLHDKPTREESQVVIKLNSEGIGISQDGGDSYPWGITFTGAAILDMIYAIGLNADYITTGAFEIRKDGKVMVLMDKDTGQVILRPDTFELSSGATIGSIAQDAVDKFVNGSYKDTIDELKKQADQKAETWYQSSDPSTGWTSAQKSEHKGDIWYNTSNQKTYIYSGSAWVESEADVPQEVFDKIDGKAQVFVSTPTPPYHEGDLWYGGTSSDVKVCTRERLTGPYNSSDWAKRDRYVDSTTASAAGTTAAQTAINNLTQTDILNKLTRNGLDNGIYLLNGKLYVSFAAMRGDQLTLGGANNANGYLRILNASGVQTGIWDNGRLQSEGGGYIQSVDFKMSTYEAGSSGSTGTLISGCKLDLDGKAFYTPQITIKDNYMLLKGYMTIGSRNSSYTIGGFSFAQGYSNVASGLFSFASGAYCTASNQGAHAEGQNAIASSLYSHAEGLYTNSTATASHAEGTYTTAKGEGSHAEGTGTEATTYYAHAEGNKAIASGTAAHAEGRETTASGYAAHTEGYLTSASGSYSHAEGYNSSTTVTAGHAEGYHSTASAAASHAQGINTVSNVPGGFVTGINNESSYLFTVGTGNEAESADGFFVTADGDSVTSGTDSHAVSTDYGEVLQYSYNTTSPMYGDIGEGEIGEDGKCYVSIDPVFAETADIGSEYQVFLQKEGPGDLWVEEKAEGYFVASGTVGLKFAWELKAKKRSYTLARLDNIRVYDPELREQTSTDVFEADIEMEKAYSAEEYRNDRYAEMITVDPIDYAGEAAGMVAEYYAQFENIAA